MDPPGQPLHRRLSRYFWGFPPFLALVETMALAFISRIWTWWVRRSSKAPVRRSEPNISVHSSNGKLEVTRIEPRS